MKLRKKFNKVTAWILTCILFFTMAFSITSEAYGEGYTHAKQFKNCHIYNGIDVSTWNKQIDWNAVKASGIDFAFIKVGGRGWGSAGTLYHDSRALENLKGAKAAGIKIGVYFFSQAITEKEAAEEAQYTINYLHTYGISIDLPIAMPGAIPVNRESQRTGSTSVRADFYATAKSTHREDPHHAVHVKL